MSTVLVTGSSGQIGSELTQALSREGHTVISFDHHPPQNPSQFFYAGDILDKQLLEEIITRHQVSQIYHLVSLLSATGERDPHLAWQVNMGGLKNILDLAVAHKIQVFWPSSIAVFGPTTPRVDTPQHTILEPTTIYGVTKVSGELLCQYYYQKYGLDVRSLRYPGLISYKTPPGGGTTDYAVAVFYAAAKKEPYTCFVRQDTVLPMMYMDDAIKATLDIMSAPEEKISIRTSYNLSALSFSVTELVAEINKVTALEVDYQPDFRQAIADSWPQSIDDSVARSDWNWSPTVDLPKMVKLMVEGLA